MNWHQKWNKSLPFELVCLMKNNYRFRPILLFLFFILLLPMPLPANVVCMCVTSPVQFLQVIDGDTIWVSREDKKILVQIAGIDAPELESELVLDQDCPSDLEKAKKAKAFLHILLSTAKKVGLIIEKELQGASVIAEVYVDGLSVGQELLYKYLAVEGEGNWCK